VYLARLRLRVAPSRAPSRRADRGGLVVALSLVAMAAVLWVRLVPLSLDRIDPADRAQFTYEDAGGGEHVYLGGFPLMLSPVEA
jgi:hypothetical protein